MIYFADCFICGSSQVCEHRERELVMWWISYCRQAEALIGLPVPAVPVGIVQALTPAPNGLNRLYGPFVAK